MAYGMQIYNTDNSLAYDSNSPGGVFIKFITLPGSTTYIDTPKIEYLPLEYAYSTVAGSPAEKIIIIPTKYGDHIWTVNPGYYSTGQIPYLEWYDKRYMPAFTQRATTILMVFGV
jgi:hypothetical protein